jgi:hypothetical protein
VYTTDGGKRPFKGWLRTSAIGWLQQTCLNLNFHPFPAAPDLINPNTMTADLPKLPAQVIRCHPSDRPSFCHLETISSLNGSSHRYITTGADSAIAVRKELDGQPIHTLKASQNELEDKVGITGIAVSFNPAGGKLVVAVSDEDHFVKVQCRLSCCCRRRRDGGVGWPHRRI